MTNMPSDEHTAWEARLGRIAEAAALWREKTSREPDVIEPGSDLAGDDSGFLGFSVSNLVGYSLAAATEHLDFTLSVMKATSTLYPTAYLTVLRTSLLSASHAAWILEPDQRAERQLRALEFLADDLRAQLVMVRETFITSESARASKDKMIALLLARQADLQPIADALRPGLQVEKCQVNNTRIIEVVAQATHDENLAIGGVNAIWRTGSAAAHGSRGFATMRLKNDQIVKSATGMQYSMLRGI